MTAACAAQVQTFHVRPVATHPDYDPLEDSSAVSYNMGSQQGRLFLFLGGTGSSSSTGYNALRLFTAGLGIDFINLSYPNAVATASLADDPDTLVFDAYRQEACFGTPVSDAVSIDSLNAIHARAVNLLQYLALTYPAQDWGQYLAGPGAPDWSRIIVGGHSQGSGHACYLAKHFAVERVLMFSGPNDYSDLHANAANWVGQAGLTPVNRHYSYLSLYDEAVAYYKQLAVVERLGMLADDDTTHVDAVPSPYGSSHCLYTTQPPGLVLLDHNVPIMLSTTNTAVWTYLLSDPVATHAGPGTTATGLVAYPNPTSSSVAVRLRGSLAGKVYTLLDPSGRTVTQGRVPPTDAIQIDLSGQGPGVYLLRIAEHTTRIVKQ